MDRRGFLLLACPGAISIAGCSGTSGTSPGLWRVLLSNPTTRNVESEIKIKKEGKKKYMEDIAVPPSSEIEIVERWMRDSANYSIEFSIVGGESEVITTEKIGERNPEWGQDMCVDFIFDISKGGNISLFSRGVKCSSGTNSA
jgi:hypothetical protein